MKLSLPFPCQWPIKLHVPSNISGRRGGLMVSALDSGLSGPGWARHLILTVSLSTQVYKWVPVNLMLGVTLRWTSIPSRGE